MEKVYLWERMIVGLLAGLSANDRRVLLAHGGGYSPAFSDEEVTSRLVLRGPAPVLDAARENPALLDACFRASGGGRFPGRAEALLAVARALGLPLPNGEYSLPEEELTDLVARARRARGARLVVRAAPGHKGRVGDAVERLLLGGRAAGASPRASGLSDHAAAEIKSVPVSGDKVVERVKLGVVSATSNPLEKCARVLFVFVEQRGATDQDYFVRGHGLVEFDDARWRAMWERGHLVETAAGSTENPARGLYLVPAWFRETGLWPPD